MKKKHTGKQHKTSAFEKKDERTLLLPSEQRMLTAEGFRRRSPGCQSTRSIGLYRGRRQGKKD